MRFLEIIGGWINRYFSNEEAVYLIVFCAFALLLLFTLGGVLAPVLTGLIVAFLLVGFVDRLKALRVPEFLAVVIAFVLFLGAAIATFLVIVPLLIRQTRALVEALPDLILRLQQLSRELVEAFPASELQHLAWVVRPDAGDMAAAMESWLEGFEEQGGLAAVMERYYGHVEIFDYVDLRAYRRRIQSRLPRYRALFEQASKDHDIPWTLLAAQSYQESHWNPKAKSPTGVRGLMMLTQPTAKAMGVDNRLDPAQSVEGGARYLRRMLSRVPESVTGDDRLWLALAAYNVGFGHLRDARVLAERLGRDPDRWHELDQVLPLLAKKQYYRDLRYGYARGSEPVIYVQRIRNYQEILAREVSIADNSPAQPRFPARVARLVDD